MNSDFKYKIIEHIRSFFHPTFSDTGILVTHFIRYGSLFAGTDIWKWRGNMKKLLYFL